MANKFLVWVDVGSDVMSQTAFSSLTDRISGFKSGTRANAANVNAGLRQANLVAAALMNACSPNSQLDLNSSLDDVTNELKSRLSIDLNVANGQGQYSISTAVNASRVTGSYASAFGDIITNSGYCAFAAGRLHTISGQYSGTLGFSNTVANRYSFGFGAYLNTSADYQTVIGKYNADDANAMFIIGAGAGASASERANVFVVRADSSVSWGDQTTSAGSGATAMGSQTNASVRGSTTMGGGTKAISPFTTVVGLWNEPKTDSIFEIGCGTSDTARRTGLTVTRETFNNDPLSMYMNLNGRMYALQYSGERMLCYGGQKTDNNDVVIYSTYLALKERVDKLGFSSATPSLIAGLTAGNFNYVRREGNVVYGIIDIVKSESGVFASPGIIATLPAEFAPNSIIPFWAGAKALVGSTIQYTSIIITIATNGELSWRYNTSIAATRILEIHLCFGYTANPRT